MPVVKVVLVKDATRRLTLYLSDGRSNEIKARDT